MTQNVQRRCVHSTSIAPLHFLKCVHSPHTPKPIRTTPGHHFLAQPLRLIRLDQKVQCSSPSIDASSVTPRKCNADVYAQYPSRHYTSPSVCNSPHTQKPKRTTPDHHNLAHPLRSCRVASTTCTLRRRIELWERARCAQAVY